jgi:hypothetical protein
VGVSGDAGASVTVCDLDAVLWKAGFRLGGFVLYVSSTDLLNLNAGGDEACRWSLTGTPRRGFSSPRFLLSTPFRRATLTCQGPDDHPRLSLRRRSTRNMQATMWYRQKSYRERRERQIVTPRVAP